MIGRKIADRMAAATLCLAALGAAGGGCGLILGIQDLSGTNLDAGRGGGDGGDCKSLDDDPKNCGVCGHDCLGMPCTDGVCSPLISVLISSYGAYGLAIDAKRAYVGTGDTNGRTVVSVALDGTDLKEVADGGDHAYSLAINANSVYWTNEEAVAKAPLDKDSSAQIIFSSQNDVPEGIAVDASGIYWVNQLSGDVWWASLDGASKNALTGINQFGLPNYIAIDATSVYWTNSGDGNVWKVDKYGDGVGLTHIASGQNQPLGIAVDSSFVYWVNPGHDGNVMRAPLNGGIAEKLADVQGGFSIVLDVNYAYVAGSTQLVAVPIGGGPPIPVTHERAFAVAVDTEFVYWTTGAMTPPGYLRKVPKLP